MQTHMTRCRLACLVPFFLLFTTSAHAQPAANVARLVVWQPKPGMARDFEEGYKRHLEWHRKNNDPWTWHGWMIASGERDGYFMDGTFSHRWTDLDSPVSPAADGADNDLNTVPYADVRSAATYESVLGEVTTQLLTSTLLTLYHFDLVPGAHAEFESLISAGLRTQPAIRHALLRPANGATGYILLLSADKPSDFAAQSAFVRNLLQGMRQKTRGNPVLADYRTETARYRADLSYVPYSKVAWAHRPKWTYASRGPRQIMTE